MKHNPLIAAALAALVAVAAAPTANAQSTPAIPGYSMGQKSLAKAPFTLADLESLKKTLLFTDEDVRYLRMSKAILVDQTEPILDVWYDFVASTPELVFYFKNNKTGTPDSAYLGAVRKRFGQWIRDLTIRDSNVSRRHACVVLYNGQYWIVDQQSTNGIDYNGGKVDRKVIEDGDSYRICDHEIQFVYR